MGQTGPPAPAGHVSGRGAVTGVCDGGEVPRVGCRQAAKAILGLSAWAETKGVGGSADADDNGLRGKLQHPLEQFPVSKATVYFEALMGFPPISKRLLLYI